jgi:hypothetical protein
MVELGRIRMGDKVATAKGGQRPNKLSHWRVTSPHRDALEVVASLYGGEVRAWDDPSANPPNQFEVYTESETLRVVMPAVAQFEQYLEAWKSGGCTVRTDGQWDYLNERPWTGPTDKDGLAEAGIRPCTRLSVMLEGVPGFGVWRLEVHGYYAALELSGAMTVIEQGGLAGSFSAGELVLAQRQAKQDGKTIHYVTPVLLINRTPEDLAAGAAHVKALESGELPGIDENARALRQLNAGPTQFDPDDPFGLEGTPAPSYVDTGTGEVLEGELADGPVDVIPPPSGRSEIGQAIADAAATPDTSSGTDWSTATVAQLAKALKAAGLTPSGGKAELLAQVQEAGL